MGPVSCFERRVQTIECNGVESRVTCIEEMHAVSSTPIRSTNGRRGSPRLCQQFPTRGSIYSVPLSPNVSPVGKSHVFPEDCPSPARGSRCSVVNGLTSVTPKRGRSCLTERLANHHVVPATDKTIKKQHILKRMPPLPVAQKSPQYLPLVIVSDSEDNVITVCPKRVKQQPKNRKNKELVAHVVGDDSGMEGGRNLSCKRRITGGEMDLGSSRGSRRSLTPKDPESERKTAEIIDLVLRGGVGREDVVHENEEGSSGDDTTPRKRGRNCKRLSNRSYNRESSLHQEIRRSVRECGEPSEYESNDSQNISENDGESDEEVSIAADRNEELRWRNQIGREMKRYQGNAAPLNISGRKVCHSRTRLEECLDTSGPQPSYSRMRRTMYMDTNGPQGNYSRRSKRYMDTSGPQDNRSKRSRRYLDTSGPVGNWGYSETNYNIPLTEDSEEDQNESSRYSYVPRVPKSKFHERQMQKKYAQAQRNGGFISESQNHESEDEMSGFIDDEPMRRGHPFIQTRNESYSVQDSFCVEYVAEEQDSQEESFENMRALQIASRRDRSGPKKSINVVKRNTKPLRTLNETTTNGDRHPSQKKVGGQSARKRMKYGSQIDDENGGPQATDSINPPKVKKRGRPPTKGKSPGPNKKIRTEKSRENVELQVESSDGADGEKSPVRKKVKRGTKNVSESFDSAESQRKTENQEVQKEAAVTEVTEPPTKAKRGRKPKKKEVGKAEVKTRESDKVDSQPSDPTECPPKKRKRGRPPKKTVEASAAVNDKSSPRCNDSSSGTESEKENSSGSKRRTLFSKNALNSELSLNQVQGTPLNASKKTAAETQVSPNSRKRRLQGGSSSDYLRKKVLTMRLGASPFRASAIEKNAFVATSTPVKSMSESRSLSMSRPENITEKGNDSTNQPQVENSNAITYPQPSLNIDEKLQNLPSVGASGSALKTPERSPGNDVKMPAKPSSNKVSVKVLVDGKEKKMDLFADYSKIPFNRRTKGKEECVVHYGSALDVLGLGSGYIHLNPGTEKGYQKTKSHNMIFLILNGEVLVKIHESELSANPGDFFAVPKGCKYNVTATGNKKAVIAYFKSKAE